MNVQRSARNCAVALGAAVLIGTGVSSPAVAAPAPYTCQIQVSLEFGQGIRKISVVVNCANPGELVRIDIIANVDGNNGVGNGNGNGNGGVGNGNGNGGVGNGNGNGNLKHSVGTASTRQLGTFRADENGVARGTVTLPQNASCDATIKATGLESKRTAYSNIYIEPCNQEAGAAATQKRTAPAAGERSITVNPAGHEALVASDTEETHGLKSATKARAVHEASAPRTITLAGSDRDMIDEAVRIEPELLAVSSDSGGPINPTTAAAGLGLVLAGMAGGTLLARRRAGANHY